MATYNNIKKIKIGDNTFVFHVPTASEVGALPSSTTIPAITLNGSGSTSPSFYAPTTVGTSGYVLKSNGSGAPTWTSATLTDTKVTTAALTSGTLYYPILATSNGTATRQIDSTIKGLTYKSTAGTTSTVGKAELTLGNSTASGTANNEQGQLILYGSTAYKHTIEGAPTANRTITLPNASGTLALTSDCPYLVGDIYITTKSESPSTIWSGTQWEQIQGRFLVAAGDNGETGDEALNLTAGATGGETNHKLTDDESGVPQHTHGPNTGTYFAAGTVAFSVASNKAATGSSGISNLVRQTGTISSPSTTKKNTAADAASAHNNLPPYLAVYMWKRTA